MIRTPKKKKKKLIEAIDIKNNVASIIVVGSQIIVHTQMETGDGPNKPNTINL